MRWFANIKQVREHAEGERQYHERNAERYRQGLNNDGKVSGLAGKQTQREIFRAISYHNGAASAYRDLVEAIDQIRENDPLLEAFGPMYRED